MKETKVYVDELPKDCFKCLFMTDNQEGYDGCFCKILDERVETKSRLKGCPLIDIKTHDRELVRQVCEKIRIKVDNISMHTATKERLMIMCEEIEKEYEK